MQTTKMKKNKTIRIYLKINVEGLIQNLTKWRKYEGIGAAIFKIQIVINVAAIKISTFAGNISSHDQKRKHINIKPATFILKSKFETSSR